MREVPTGQLWMSGTDMWDLLRGIAWKSFYLSRSTATRSIGLVDGEMRRMLAQISGVSRAVLVFPSCSPTLMMPPDAPTIDARGMGVPLRISPDILESCGSTPHLLASFH